MIEMQVFAIACGEGIKQGVKVAVEGAKNGFESAIEWKGHAVRELKNLFPHISNHSFLALGLIVVANTLFFLVIINPLLKNINRTLENQKEPIRREKRVLKLVFVNVVLPGAAVFGFNQLLSLATSINGWLILGMTIAAIAARLLINHFSESENRTIADIQEGQQRNFQLHNSSVVIDQGDDKFDEQ